MAAKKKKSGGFFWKLLFLLALGVFCFSTYQLFTIYKGYKEGVDEYRAVAHEAVVKSVQPLEAKQQRVTETGETLTPELVEIETPYKEGVDEYRAVAHEAVVKSVQPLEAKQQRVTETGETLTPELVEIETPDVDFEKLQQINPDVIGWLEIEALDEISYPIVQGKDNDYYLHRTFKKADNYAVPFL